MDVLSMFVIIGSVTFAAAGALTAVRQGFDLVGIVILAFVTAIGGGSIRDLIVGTVPPTALTDELLLWAVFATALLVALLHHRLRTGLALYSLDTVSLGLFAALGAERGASAGFGLWGTVFAGALSGVGGGVIRDVLSGEVPGVLYRSGDFYATAAVAGAAVTYVLLPLVGTAAVALGALTAVTVRVGSRLAGLELPVPRTPTD
jgi:uncharacterized membrane protein YeiH